VGGRWKNWKDVSIDLAVALPFWFIWELTAKFVNHLLGPSQAKSVETLLPQGLIEILLWVVLSISAGFSEEITFRGYFQKQAAALSGSTAVAVIIQALIFGVAHAYQGIKNVITIVVLGILYGTLAAWRKTLRPGMIAHAFSDINGGLLRFM
jgi:membrane protease YdiL (CAAX protease family)